jgi:hypothetical protein
MLSDQKLKFDQPIPDHHVPATSSLLSQFQHRSPWLTRVGLAHLALFAVLALLMLVDDRQITGVNLWLKPAKFAASIGIYVLTLAWLLGELARPRRIIALVVAITCLMLSMEQTLITMQAVRETTSHYNNATPFDSAVFSLMGLGIGINSLAAAIVLLLFCIHRNPARPGYLWGIRTGLLIFLLGSAQGFVMINNGGHTVGAADGGPGIPLLGWSTIAGDLRVAHFLGIHAIQILPLLGWVLDRRLSSTRWRIALMLVLAAAYAKLTLWSLIHALAGLSWFGWLA